MSFVDHNAIVDAVVNEKVWLGPKQSLSSSFIAGDTTIQLVLFFLVSHEGRAIEIFTKMYDSST